MSKITIEPQPSMAEAKRIQAFWNAHYAELLHDYPEQFVAVADGVVVASGADLGSMADELRKRGIDPRTDVAIQFISAKSASLLL